MPRWRRRQISPTKSLRIGAHKWSGRLAEIGASLSVLVASFYEGRAIRQGLDVLIVGRANVGKSDLLNALALTERAIVPLFRARRAIFWTMSSTYGA